MLLHSVHIVIEDLYINFTIIWKTAYTHYHNYWSRILDHSNTKRKHTLNQQLINSLTGVMSICDLDSVHTPPLIEPDYDLKH